MPDVARGLTKELLALAASGWDVRGLAAYLVEVWLPDHDAEVAAKALKETADAWQHGQWADAPRSADRVQERIANAQFVTDWLRARAAAAQDQAVDHG